MKKQSAKVFYDRDILAGTITKMRNQDGKDIYEFVYDEIYFQDDAYPSIAFQFPKNQKKFQSNYLFGFFFGLLAEGGLKKIQCMKLRIDENDHFTRLIKTAGYDTIGMITVKENNNQDELP